jgi:hypothetical protein
LIHYLTFSSCRTYPETFDELGADILCNEIIWRQFGYFLVRSATKSMCVEYMRKTLGLARDRFGKDAQYRSFFADIDKTDDRSNWFKGLLRGMSVIKFEEAQGEGETVTSQAIPLYTLHRRHTKG